MTATLKPTFIDPPSPGMLTPFAVFNAVNLAFTSLIRYFDHTAGAFTLDVSYQAATQPFDASLTGNPGSDLLAVGTQGGNQVVAPTFGLGLSARANLSSPLRVGTLFVNPAIYRIGTAREFSASSIDGPVQRELEHALGLRGVVRNTPAVAAPPSQQTVYDGSLRAVPGPPDAGTTFNGPNAQAVYGGPVPVLGSDPYTTTVADGLALDSSMQPSSGSQPLDIALLRDAGLPALTGQELLEHSIARLYFGAFGRVADGASLVQLTTGYRPPQLDPVSSSDRQYLQALLDRSAFLALAAVADGLVGSAEFASRYGALSDSDFVRTVFQNVYGRAPSVTDLDTGLQALRFGDIGTSRGTLLTAYAQSDEARGRLSANANITYSGTVEAQVARAYDTAFGRDADPGGFVAYTRALITGTTLQQVALSFLGSNEFATRYGAAPSDAALVTGLYQNTLGRAPEAAGQALYVRALAAGLARADLVVAFSESQEHIGLVAARATARDAAGLYVDTAPHLGIIPMFGAG